MTRTKGDLDYVGPNGTSDPLLVRCGPHLEPYWVFAEDPGNILTAPYVTYVINKVKPHPRWGLTADGAAYVGVTSNFPMRYTTHLLRSPWLKPLGDHSVTLRGFTDLFDARVCEAALIAELDPLHNVKKEKKYRAIADRYGMPDDLFLAEVGSKRLESHGAR